MNSGNKRLEFTLYEGNSFGSREDMNYNRTVAASTIQLYVDEILRRTDNIVSMSGAISSLSDPARVRGKVLLFTTPRRGSFTP